MPDAGDPVCRRTPSRRPRSAGSRTSRFAGSELVTFDAIGHCPQLSAPGATRPGDRRVRGQSMTDPAFTALLEDSAEDLYDNAPCGYVSTSLDGTIAKVNATLLGWLGYDRDELVGRCRFPDLLTVGGRIYYETHFAPLLRMRGELGGIALELTTADGTRLPVLLTSMVKIGGDGQAQLIRTTVFDARDRRSYEQELLRAREGGRERTRPGTAAGQDAAADPAAADPADGAGHGGRGLLPPRVGRRGRRRLLRPVPAGRGHLGLLPRRRVPARAPTPRSSRRWSATRCAPPRCTTRRRPMC